MVKSIALTGKSPIPLTESLSDLGGNQAAHPRSRPVLHVHVYVSGQGGVGIHSGCVSSSSLSWLALLNTTTPTAAAKAVTTTMIHACVLAGASCGELLPGLNEYAREVLCSMSGTE